jgi:hypothetical protein
MNLPLVFPQSPRRHLLNAESFAAGNMSVIWSADAHLVGVPR